MNTLNDVMSETINDFASELKGLFENVPSLLDGFGFLKLEQNLEAICQNVCGHLMRILLQLILEQPDFKRVAIENMKSSGKKWKSKGRRTVRIRLASGIVAEVKTSYYVSDNTGKKGRKKKKRGKKGSGCYPVLDALGIKDRITPAAMEKIARMLAVCSSISESRSQLEKAGIKLDIKTVRTVGWNFGWQAIETHLERLKLWLNNATQADSPFAGQRVVITVDGGRLRERIPTTRGRRKKNGRRSFQAEWSEPRVICLYLMDENGKKIAEAESCWYDSMLSNADETFDILKAHLKGLGIEYAEDIVFIADGATWIWNRTDELWKDLGIESKVYEIVDFYHAAEHLHSIVELRRNWSKNERDRWFRKQRHLLRLGKVEQALEEIKKLAKGRRSKEYLKKMNYFIGHMERMRYDLFEALCFPLGSGAVESGVRRIINMRMKGPGILWLRRSAQAMLLLRSYWKAGRWDELMQLLFCGPQKNQEFA